MRGLRRRRMRHQKLQATNEELETLNEEPQASNEQLTLAMRDLESRGSELAAQRSLAAR